MFCFCFLFFGLPFSEFDFNLVKEEMKNSIAATTKNKTRVNARIGFNFVARVFITCEIFAPLNQGFSVPSSAIAPPVIVFIPPGPSLPVPDPAPEDEPPPDEEVT